MNNDITIHFLGTNGWFNTKTGDTTCHLLDFPNCYIILDAGNALYKVDKYIVQDKPIFLFLSHFHLDHIFGLHILNKFEFKQGLTICCYDGGRKILHHLMKGPYTIPINQLKYDVKIKEISQGYNKDFPFMVKAQALVHSTRCFGYRFEFENRVVTYCTDTGLCSSIYDLANNANLLIAECSLRPGQIKSKWASNPHMSPMDAALVARDSNVEQLALIHFDADNYTTLEQRKEAVKEAEKYFPNVIFTQDDMVLEV